MPTQRPFLSNFLAAFQAHSQPLPKASSSISTSSTAVSSAAIWTAAAPVPKAQHATSSEPTISSPRPINPKTHPYSSSAASTSADRQHVQSSLSPLQHTVSPQTHMARSPPSPGLPVYGPQSKPAPNYPTCQEVGRNRRGSDSSLDTGGFREPRGRVGEKWFIGGRTATGEERYYKLNMVQRDRSSDRISADQLSL
ncbi:Hypothetical protein R9X50_00690900 [Acrodontium crateriforme]|uniref:Uncharacterized protein n=1 Tax=Acrodontium crateriforme TaxID=150365 RepID=A0AAQ3MAI0_9PEZI|nr:Hypothetical protein R9X50_00690900 [Acrodontium crateriforme]